MSIRVIGITPGLASYGAFGTVLGGVLDDNVRPGNLMDGGWLDDPDQDVEEIDGGHLRVISEGDFLVEAADRAESVR